MRNSWKLLAILLVTYACISSFFLPMAPGLQSVNPTTKSDSTFTLTVSGYNTHFDADTVVLWLQSEDKQAVRPVAEEIYSATIGSFEFQTKDFPQNGNYSLWVYNNIDKTLFLPQAHFVEQSTDSVLHTTFDRSAYVMGRDKFEIPFKNILYETIRNLNFHVTMWFVLLILMTISLVYSVKYLNGDNQLIDIKASQAAKVGLYFALLGIISGSIWAKYTWGAWWVKDPKLNGAALSFLVYLAYLVLRQSIPDDEKKARISAVYNIFAYVLMIVFIQVLPRLTDSLHPGNGGNPAFSQYDLDNNLKMIFYPAALGWILIGIWIWTIKVRIQKIELHTDNEEL
ncbi:cytochrome c biogenesis protein [Luteibaculum oceani]|nr:cytochrome c biogenesis protein CcsA [Luteibaculum oceani]